MSFRNVLPQVLTIAGSDSGGGAGIQADIKAISANGAFALSVLTSITAQNTRGVTKAFDLPPSVIEAQMQAVFNDFSIKSVKTGMLLSKKIVLQVARLLKTEQVKNLVVDPVILSKNGYPLLHPSAITAMKSDLIPLARLVIPNVYEAELLSGIKIRSLVDAESAARIIFKMGCRAVLIKGGHLISDPGCDLLYDGRTTLRYKGEWIASKSTHGTGCVYSAAIAAHLAQGRKLNDAIQRSKAYITEAIRHSFAIGHGIGPVNPLWMLSRS